MEYTLFLNIRNIRLPSGYRFGQLLSMTTNTTSINIQKIVYKIHRLNPYYTKIIHNRFKIYTVLFIKKTKTYTGLTAQQSVKSVGKNIQ